MNVESKVKKIIVEQLFVGVDDVADTAKFADDLGADSLDAIELVMAFEEEFDLEIPDEEVENMKTVADAVAYIQKQVAAK
jgi:acyl carrier protein